MATEDFLVGGISSENHYDASADTPTIFDFWNATENAGISDNESIAVVPFGKVGSDKRLFGSTTGIIQKSDIMVVLLDMAGGDPAQRGIMWIDPEQTGPFLKQLLNLQNDPIHITGIGFRKV
jgi:hypothetical protein